MERAHADRTALPEAAREAGPRPLLADAPSAVLALQATAGNTAVTQMLQRAPADPQFRVTIVELGMSRLSEKAREAARKTIDAELDRVAATSKKDKVKPGFDVKRTKSLGADEAKAFGSTDFVVYLIPSRDPDLVLKRVKMHLDIPESHEQKVLDAVTKQLASEGGANVEYKGKSVSFVATDLFDKEMGRVPGETEDERAAREERVGQQMAELMLHELGHGMGAEHDKEIMAKSVSMDFGEDAEAEHFTEKSRKQIVGNLDRR
jgi:hypothetical protein